MGRIVSACAWANNEVACVAWDIDGLIDDGKKGAIMRYFAK